MRIVIGSLFLLFLATTGVAQESAPAPEPMVQVRALTIVAGDLPAADRQRIEHSLQGGTCGVQELAERVRMSLLRATGDLENWALPDTASTSPSAK